MTTDPKNNISSRTSDKKHGALYRDDVKHVESQDNVEKGRTGSDKQGSEEE